MKITLELVDGDKLIATLGAMPQSVHVAISQKIDWLRFRLEKIIKTVKLDGGVLNRKTGRLARSIQSRKVTEGNYVVGEIFSAGDVPYARIHELGGKTTPHLIVPKKVSVLKFFWEKSGKTEYFKSVNHPGSDMPERSYMRSTLRESSVLISTELKKSVVQGLNNAG